MVAHEKDSDDDLFAGDSFLARALRGELKTNRDQACDLPRTPSAELPIYWERVRVRDDGVAVTDFHLYFEDGGNMMGGEECSPGSRSYDELIERHGELRAGRISMFYRYTDGRTELT